MISWVVCNHQCCVYLAVDAMEFLTGSSDRRDNEAGPVASASNLTASRELIAFTRVRKSVCKAVVCRSAMVQTGCGEVGVESWPV
jgi:hypothetical protein